SATVQASTRNRGLGWPIHGSPTLSCVRRGAKSSREVRGDGTPTESPPGLRRPRDGHDNDRLSPPFESGPTRPASIQLLRATVQMFRELSGSRTANKPDGAASNSNARRSRSNESTWSPKRCGAELDDENTIAISSSIVRSS